MQQTGSRNKIKCSNFSGPYQTMELTSIQTINLHQYLSTFKNQLNLIFYTTIPMFIVHMFKFRSCTYTVVAVPIKAN